LGKKENETTRKVSRGVGLEKYKDEELKMNRLSRRKDSRRRERVRMTRNESGGPTKGRTREMERGYKESE